jgi:hypothetical protein
MIKSTYKGVVIVKGVKDCVDCHKILNHCELKNDYMSCKHWNIVLNRVDSFFIFVNFHLNDFYVIP